MTISVPKLILLVILFLAAWYVSRVVSRGAANLERRRRNEAAEARRPAQRGSGAIEDQVPCRTCGAYVSPGARNCGRPGCPWRR